MDGQEFHAETNTNPAPASGTETHTADTSTSLRNTGSDDSAMESAYANAMSKRGIKTSTEAGKKTGGSEGSGTTAKPDGGSGPSPTNSEPPAERGAQHTDKDAFGGEPAKKANTGSQDDAERRARNRQQAAMRIARKQGRQRIYQEELERRNKEKEAFEQEGEN